MTPRRLGAFEVVESLGEGDFSSVYVVRDPSGSAFAAKTSRLGEEASIDRLENEIRVLQRLSHDQIPTYVDDGDDSGIRYLVMERMPGSSIRSKLASYRDANKRFSDIEALQVGVKLFDVLAYLHRLDEPLVHRDVKDANIVVTTPSGKVSLIDFGFAKPDGSIDKRFADSFFRAGAPRYAPPAKHRHPAVAKASHDVFAVGVLAVSDDDYGVSMVSALQSRRRRAD